MFEKYEKNKDDIVNIFLLRKNYKMYQKIKNIKYVY